MKEKISKIMQSKLSKIIALIVLVITVIGTIAVNKIRLKENANLDSETLRAMTYGEVKDGDEK